MKVASDVDAGDVLCQVETAIETNEDYGALYERLAIMGAQQLLKVLKYMKQESCYRCTPQNHTLATHTEKIEKDDCMIDWALPAPRVQCLIRGLAPMPGAYTSYEGLQMHIYQSQLYPGDPKASPGQIVQHVKNQGFVVVCGDGQGLLITELKLQGGKRMNGQGFLCGKGSCSLGKVLVALS